MRHVNIKLPADLAEWIDRRVRQCKESRSVVIRRVLREAYEQHNKGA